MNEPEQRRLIGPIGIIIDCLLTGIFCLAMIGILKPHVPSDNPLYQYFFAGYGSLSLSGVFWLALQCLRVTLMDQLQTK